MTICNCAWAYVDNIIYKIKSLDNLLLKLYIFFKIFVVYNISIKRTKFFVNYFNAGLLGQEINILSLIIVKKKLNTIKLLQYLLTRRALKYYIELTSYFCFYIYYYAKLIKYLQIL